MTHRANGSGLQEKMEMDGYAVLEQLIPHGKLESIQEAAARVIDDFDPDLYRSIFSTRDRDRGRDRYFMESAESVNCFLEEDAIDSAGNLSRPKHLAINKIGHALHDCVPEFNDFCRQPAWRELLDTMGYCDPVLWQSMYIFKQPGIGGEVRWHQDATYLSTQPPNVTAFWVAIEDATVNNGCLWVQPGGHRSNLREIYEVDPITGQGELKTLSDQPWPGAKQAKALEVPKGSVIVFTDYLPHYSSQNRSGRSRQAFTMHFSEAHDAWSPRNWLQRPVLGHYRV